MHKSVLKKIVFGAMLFLVLGLPGYSQEPNWVFAFQVSSPERFIKSFFGIRELEPLNNLFPAGLWGMIEQEVPPISQLGKLQHLILGMGSSENGTLFIALFQDGKLLGTDQRIFSVFESLFGGRNQGPDQNSSTQQTPAMTCPTVSTPAPDGIAGFISPRALGNLFRTPILDEMNSVKKEEEALCAGNCRKLFRELRKEAKTEKRDVKAGPILKKNLPSCPLKGTYSSNGTKVLCSHQPPKPLDWNSSPAGDLVKIVKPMVEKLLQISDLQLTISPEKGTFTVEPADKVKEGLDFAVIPSSMGPAGYPNLEWVSDSLLDVPLTSSMPFVFFLGLDFDDLLNSHNRMGDPNAAPTDRLERGVLVLASRGIDPDSMFRQQQGEIPMAIGIIDPKGLATDFIENEMLRGSAQKKITEEQGRDLTTLSVGTPDGREGRDIGIIDIPPYRFFTGGKEMNRLLIRGLNGEEPRLSFFKKVGGQVKFFAAIRIDGIGKGVANLLGQYLFEKEGRECQNSIRSHFEAKVKDQPGKSAYQAMENLTEVPPELASACPRSGLLILEKRLTCAVHQRRFMPGKRNPAEPDVDFSTNRWLVLALVKKDGKALFEARIVDGENQQ